MRRRTSIAVFVAVTMVGVAACTGSDDSGDASPGAPERRITMWSGATDSRHLAGTKRILTGFTEATGIEVELVPVDMADVRKLAGGNGRRSPSPGRTGEVPDVIGALPVAAAHALASSGLIDTTAVGNVLGDLGRDTFQQTTLRLAARGDDYVAVPSDAAIQLVVYRADLFADASLAVPDTFGKIETAAAELDTKKRAGIVVPSAANDVATARTFEHLALANGCRLLDDNGEISVDATRCGGTFAFYRKLASYGPSGAQSAADARKAYLAGEAAMIPASSAILDDLGGLDGDSAATCPECEDDPAHLAKNSGIVAAIRGPHGTRPVQSGTVASWTITNAADTAAAQRLVTYMMAEGYLEWLGVAPGGTLPVRLGTADDGRRYSRAWATLPAGAGGSTSLSGLYSPAVLDLLRASPANFGGWGQRPAEAAAISAALRDLPIPEILGKVVEGRLEPAEATGRVRQAVTSLRHRPGPSPTTARP